MKLTFQFILIISLLFISSINSQELKQVIQLYRHGARGVMGSNASPEKKYMAEQLTGVGMRQQYVLGQTLRQKYMVDHKFMSPTMNFDEILVFSTEVNRTIMSAQSNLYGFYPLGSGLQVPEGIQQKYLMPPYKGAEFEDLGDIALPHQYQPGIIHAESDRTNILLSPDKFCKNWKKTIKQFKRSPEQQKYWQQKSEEFSLTILETGQMMGNPDITIYDMPDVYDVLVSDLYAGNQMPFGFDVNSQLFQNITYLNEVLFFNEFLPEYSQQVTNTPFFYYVLQSFNNVIDNLNGGLKYSMFSAHDDNLAMILPFLGLTSMDCLNQLYYDGTTTALECQRYPGFASNIIIELFEGSNKNEHYVMVNYDGEYQYICGKKQTKCDYNDFQEYVNARIVDQDQFNNMCDNDHEVEFSELIPNPNEEGNKKKLRQQQIQQIDLENIQQEEQKQQILINYQQEEQEDSETFYLQVICVGLFIVLIGLVGQQFVQTKGLKQQSSQEQKQQLII